MSRGEQPDWSLEPRLPLGGVGKGGRSDVVPSMPVDHRISTEESSMVFSYVRERGRKRRRWPMIGAGFVVLVILASVVAVVVVRIRDRAAKVEHSKTPAAQPAVDKASLPAVVPETPSAIMERTEPRVSEKQAEVAEPRLGEPDAKPPAEPAVEESREPAAKGADVGAAPAKDSRGDVGRGWARRAPGRLLADLIDPVDVGATARPVAPSGRDGGPAIPAAKRQAPAGGTPAAPGGSEAQR